MLIEKIGDIDVMPVSGETRIHDNVNGKTEPEEKPSLPPRMKFPSKKALVDYMYNEEKNVAQVRAMKFIFDKESKGHIFITGWAGTGKSTFLKRILPFLGNYGVVAPTGIAALNVGGSTIHSYFSFNLDPYWPEFKNGRFKNHIELLLNKEKRNVIRNLKFLVIDEMSMVRADLLDRIAETLRIVRYSNEPFGGVRLIMMGDLSQLPPVLKGDDPMLTYYDTRFFFSSKSLMASGFDVVIFDKVYRQKDPKFINILNDIREGKLSKESEDILATRVVTKNFPDNAIYICSTNQESSSINQSSLQRNLNPSFTFPSYKEGDAPKDAPCEDMLTVKTGARVVMTKNGAGYVNGSMGTVTNVFVDREDPEKSYIEVMIDKSDKPVKIRRETWDKIKYSVDHGQIITYTVGTITQFPMRLGYSISAHKSQGMTLDSVILKMNRAFESGQVYTAISRCKSLEGLYLTSPILQSYIHIDDDIQLFYEKAKDNDGKFEPIPVSRIAEGMNIQEEDDDIDFDKYDLDF